VSTVPFTARELKRAWHELSATASPKDQQRLNAHRLLLFYAVECGLKSVLLKQNGRTLFNQEDIDRTGHDLRKIIKELRLGKEFSLPENLRLAPVTQGDQEIPRHGSISILHQAWRYGGQCQEPNDQACETQLENILKWIKKELT
jgi:hypothetical protein